MICATFSSVRAWDSLWVSYCTVIEYVTLQQWQSYNYNYGGECYYTSCHTKIGTEHKGAIYFAISRNKLYFVARRNLFPLTTNDNISNIVRASLGFYSSKEEERIMFMSYCLLLYNWEGCLFMYVLMLYRRHGQLRAK
jgi:hypothetical protein